ncbi:MAG: GntR family transcriptional regulator [Actinomycetota bacterium]|nr:GntR family transcriptional regulator [Actinomycetota bacterium]
MAYAWIKRELLAGAFPLSGRLSTEKLAKELDVSRTPVREALSRLHAEGLVDRHPDGGYTPSIPDLDEIVELYEVRSVLEHAALARDDHDLAALAELGDEWQNLAEDIDSITADPEFVLLDEDFHIRLASSAGNRALVSTLGGINARIRIVRMHDFLIQARVEATIEQHCGIVAAVLAEDGDRARRALTAHLDESASVVHERAATAIARMLHGRRDAR